MSLPARISDVTLVCRDIGRMAAFYRQFGWPEAPTSVPEHVVFQCTNGVVLGLFSETVFQEQHGWVADGFRGVRIAIACEDKDAVFFAHGEVAEFADLDALEQPTRSGWGCGFDFSDPEGNVWSVAHKYGSDIDERGGYFYP